MAQVHAEAIIAQLTMVCLFVFFISIKKIIGQKKYKYTIVIHNILNVAKL